MKKLAAVLAVMLSACALQEGDPCSSGASCDGKSEALYCVNGRVTRFACPGGCSSVIVSGKQFSFECSQKGATAGATCPPDFEGDKTCGSSSSTLACGKFTAIGGAVATESTWAAQTECAAPTTKCAMDPDGRASCVSP